LIAAEKEPKSGVRGMKELKTREKKIKRFSFRRQNVVFVISAFFLA
jgi:hypothetical protein